jgi:hypothetical protein
MEIETFFCDEGQVVDQPFVHVFPESIAIDFNFYMRIAMDFRLHRLYDFYSFITHLRI